MNYFFITGSSRGIGKALAENLLMMPENRVIGLSRSNTIEHERFTFIQADLSDIKLVVGQVDNWFKVEGNVDKIVLINNAAALGEVAHLGDIHHERIAEAINLNITAPMILMNAFIANFRSFRSEKLVINISSGASKRPVDGWSIYCSSKAALAMSSQVAALEAELAGDNLKVFSLSPGIVDTKMQETLREVPEKNFTSVRKFKAYKEENQLTDTADVAQKIVDFMNEEHNFHDVLQDVRQF